MRVGEWGWSGFMLVGNDHALCEQIGVGHVPRPDVVRPCVPLSGGKVRA